MSWELFVLLVLLIAGKTGSSVRPVVTFNPNWDKIINTESLTMTCNVMSPIPGDMSYTWYKDNNSIRTGQSFVIRNAKERNSGNYQCKGSNTDTSDPARLEVIHDYVILQAPLYIYEGDHVTLRCHHYPGYSAGRTIFYKDNTVIRDWKPDSLFRITNINIGKSGKYKCIKEVNGGYKYSGEVSISVKESITDPEIKVSANPIVEGDNITLTCRTEPSPFISATEVKFAFQRNGQDVQEFGSSSKYGILSAKLEDSGDYICEVRRSSNGLSKKSKEINIQIEELFSHPEIVPNPDFPREGNRVNLTCNTSITTLRNDIELQFAFYQNEKKVQKLNSSHQYIIPLAQLEDSGNYSCEARTLYNGMKKRSAVVRVVIQGEKDVDYTLQNRIRLLASGIIFLIGSFIFYSHMKIVRVPKTSNVEDTEEMAEEHQL